MQETPPKQNRAPLTHWLIVALLVAILAIQVYALLDARGQAQAQSERLEICQAAAARLAVEMDKMVDMYDEDVYRNPKTDTIQKQTLLALEYQLMQQIRLAKYLTECQ